MTVLYVDTSSNYLYAGIVQNDKLLVERALNLSHDLSTFAIDEIDKMYKEINLDKNMVDKIIVVSGPGSFTGIRIGMTFAKMYAYCLKKEITTITSLEAMSCSIPDECIKVPMIDARRGYVYAAIYDGDNALLEPEHILLNELLQKLEGLDKKYIFISNNKFNNLNVQEYKPDILKIVKKYEHKASINPHLVVPTYLKLTEAEENKMKEN